MDDSFRARASTVTRIVLAGHDRSFAEYLRVGSGNLLASAQKLNEWIPDQTGEYILLLQSMELALKSFLSRKGFHADILHKRPYGHNLVCLYDDSVAMGLKVMSDDSRKYIVWINEWHNERARIRYDFEAQRTLPMCITLFPIVQSILEQCK